MAGSNGRRPAVPDGGRDDERDETPQRERDERPRRGRDQTPRRGGGRRNAAGRTAGGDRGREVVRFAVGVYLLFGFGVVVTQLLVTVLSPERIGLPGFTGSFGRMASPQGTPELLGAVLAGMGFTLSLALLLGLAVGLAAGVTTDDDVVWTSGVGSALGLFGTCLVLFLLAVVLAPNASGLLDLVGRLLGPLVGLALGTGLIAAGGAYLANRL